MYFIFSGQLISYTHKGVCCWQQSNQCRKAPRRLEPAVSHTDSTSSGNTWNCCKDIRVQIIHLQLATTKKELHTTENVLTYYLRHPESQRWWAQTWYMKKQTWRRKPPGRCTVAPANNHKNTQDCEWWKTGWRLSWRFLTEIVLTSGPLGNTPIFMVNNKWMHYLIIFEQLPHEE